MKYKVANYKPYGVWLENKRFGAFTLHFREVRGEVMHNVCMDLDTDFIRMLAYRLQDQLKYIEDELAAIKKSLRNAGGGQ